MLGVQFTYKKMPLTITMKPTLGVPLSGFQHENLGNYVCTKFTEVQNWSQLYSKTCYYDHPLVSKVYDRWLQNTG